MSSIDLQTKGMAELQKFLDKLPAKIEANIKRQMLAAAGKVYKEAAQRNVHSISGELAKSIRISTRINKKTGKIDASVKAGKAESRSNKARREKSGAKKRVPGTFYAHFVEYGTRPHLISVPEDEKNTNIRLSAKRGKLVKESLTTINRRVLQIGNNFIGPTVMHKGSDPHPFMRPAFDSESMNAIKAAGEYVKKRLRTKHGIDTAGIEIG